MAAAAFGVAGLFASLASAGSGVRLDKTVRGSAKVESAGRDTVIRASDKAILNFRQFDVAKGERVRFIQPSETARLLSRITGGTPSRIDGSIAANGQVYFVNPAGIVFGRDAQVRANSFVASAANLADADFLRGIDRFTGGTGSVLNHGNIETADFAALLGTRVANTGVISASDGIVAMISGSELTLSRRGDTVMVKVAGGASGEMPGVDNAGTVAAARRVVIGAGDVYSLAIRHTGTIKSPNVTVQASQTAVQADTAPTKPLNVAGVVDIRGTIDASNADGAGGNIDVLGDYIALQDATLDASGSTAGGTVRVGGDWQGTGTLPHAKAVYVDTASTLRADADTSGNGGTIVAWSDHSTRFHGTATARGGTNAGNGGMVETSGGFLDVLHADVSTSVRANLNANGKSDYRNGTWLLDPIDINIVSVINGADYERNTTTIVTSNDRPIDDATDDFGTPINGNLFRGGTEANERSNATGTSQFANRENDKFHNASALSVETVIKGLKENGLVIVQTGTDRSKITEGTIRVLDPIIYDGPEATLRLEANEAIKIEAPIISINNPLNLELYAAQAFRVSPNDKTRFTAASLVNLFQANSDAKLSFGGVEDSGFNNGDVYDAYRQRSIVIRTHGGHIVGAGVGVQSFLNNRNATDFGRESNYFGYQFVNADLRTEGGDIDLRSGGTMELANLSSGGGNITLRAGLQNASQVVDGKIQPTSDGQVLYLHRRKTIDAGSGNVDIEGGQLYLSGPSLVGGNVRLAATGIYNDNGSIRATASVILSDQISEILFDLGATPSQIFGTVDRFDEVVSSQKETLRTRPLTPVSRQFAVKGESVRTADGVTISDPSLDGLIVYPMVANTSGNTTTYTPAMTAQDVAKSTFYTIQVPTSFISVDTPGQTLGATSVVGRRVVIDGSTVEKIAAPGRTFTINAASLSTTAPFLLYPNYRLAVTATNDVSLAGMSGQGVADIRGRNVAVTGPIGLRSMITAEVPEKYEDLVPLNSVKIVTNQPDGTVTLNSVVVRLPGEDEGAASVDRATAGTVDITAGTVRFTGQNPILVTNRAGGLLVRSDDVADTREQDGLRTIVAGPDYGADGLGTLYRLDRRDLLDEDSASVAALPNRPFFLNPELDILAEPFANTVDFAPSTTTRTAAEEIAGATPQTSRATEVSRNLPSDVAKTLETIGIRVRDVDSSELFASLIGSAVYDDFRARPFVGVRSADTVVKPRIPAKLATEVTDMIDNLVQPPKRDADGNLIRQNGGIVRMTRDERREEIRSHLGAAFKAYADEHGEDIDPIALRRFIDADARFTAARDDVKQIEQLLEKIDLIGLSPLELATAREAVRKEVEPAGGDVPKDVQLATYENKRAVSQ